MGIPALQLWGPAPATFGCPVCGRPIEVMADSDGVETLDRDTFLKSHRRCVAKRRWLVPLPQQPAGERRRAL